MEGSEPTSPSSQLSPEVEFQLILRQRRINDLLNEVELLRRRVEPPDHIPTAFEGLIQTSVREQKTNEEEIRLLRMVVSSMGVPEGEFAVQQKLKEVVDINKELGLQLSLERMEQLYAQRALVQRERELLWNTEAEMKENLEDMARQKSEASQLLKKYIEKYGPIEGIDENQTTHAATST